MAKFDFPPMQPLGPSDAKIMFIGEAPGADEQLQGKPFVGASGKLLREMCRSAGIDFDSTYRTNVFFKRPPNNQIEAFLTTRDQGLPGYPALIRGLYVNKLHAQELERLHDEIERVNPNVIVALGNTPLWAVLRSPPKISSGRGRAVLSADIRGRCYKVIPTYHPAFVIRTWKEKPVVIMDLIKAREQSRFPEIRLPHRRVLIDPTFEEAEAFFHDYAFKASHVVMDVETAQRQITVCGIAVSPEIAAVIPFWDDRKPTNSYWDDPRQEVAMVKLFRQLLADPSIIKIHQNGMYDMSYYVDNWGAKPQGMAEDTMLISHALWPEMKKSLGDLASLYTNEASWKMMRLRNHDDLKRE